MSAEKGDGRTLQDPDASWSPKYEQGEDYRTPEQALAMLDDVLRRNGVNPQTAPGPGGWRHVRAGAAHALAGVVEWQTEEHFLVVFSPLLEVPRDPPAEFLRWLLRLNHGSTRSARFSIQDNTLIIEISRPIRGLDPVEIAESIHEVLEIANLAEGNLQRILDGLSGELLVDVRVLPRAKMTPAEAQAASTFLGALDDHGRKVARALIEYWAKRGHPVEFRPSGISLLMNVEGKSTGVAAMMPAFGRVKQMATLGWEGLRKEFEPGEAIDEFEKGVQAFAKPKIMETTAHIEIGPAFAEKDATRLALALHRLATSVRRIKHPLFAPDPNLPSIQAKLGPETRQGIQTTLQESPKHAQEIYARLIQEWSANGGIVQCKRPGRIYLKMRARRHASGEFADWPTKFNLAVLASPFKGKGPEITVAWLIGTSLEKPQTKGTAITAFKRAVSALPGFTDHGYISTLGVSRAFDAGEAERLLKAMVSIKKAEDRAELK
ncbi:MAG: hypothetical protein ABSF61_13950 [Anaerolineales bacterium]